MLSGYVTWKRHYHRFKGYRRYPGRRGRPVYYMPMDQSEIRELHMLYGLIGGLVSLLGGVVLWAITL